MIRLAVLAAACLVSLVSAGWAQSAPSAKRVALVVGNSTYRSIEALANPVNDARLIAQTLAGLGFTIVGKQAQFDLDKTQFERVLDEFGRTAKGAEIALFYYAGHGIQVDGVNWLVPTSAAPRTQADVALQMIDASRVLQSLEAASAKLNLVILDACRNNPFAQTAAPGLAQPDPQRGPAAAPRTTAAIRSAGGGLGRMVAPSGTIIVYATQPGNVELDGDGRNSPFSAALAAVLPMPDLDVLRMFNEVGLRVSRATNGAQQPWLASSPIPGTFHLAAATAAVASHKNRYDGTWGMRKICEPLGKLTAMDINMVAVIANGELKSAIGVQGQPGYRALSGVVQADDTIEIAGVGIAAEATPASPLTAGSRFEWAYKGRFISTTNARLQATIAWYQRRGCELLLTR